MREIKFRAFNLITKQMETQPYANDEWLSECQPLNPVIDCIQEDASWSPLMQYTGLKDKHGSNSTEVYEDDIINGEGLIIGNRYETPELLEDKANLLIQGFGTAAWLDTYKEAVARGCHDA